MYATGIKHFNMLIRRCLSKFCHLRICILKCLIPVAYMKQCHRCPSLSGAVGYLGVPWLLSLKSFSVRKSYKALFPCRALFVERMYAATSFLQTRRDVEKVSYSLPTSFLQTMNFQMSSQGLVGTGLSTLTLSGARRTIAMLNLK